MRHWYLVTTKPKQDDIAEQNLVAQGYEVYRPLCRMVKKTRGKPVERTESLFPRYLFVQLDHIAQDWSPIRSTKGVMQMVRFGAYPAKITDDLIDAIKQQEQAALKGAAPAQYKKGDKLRVESGAFYGLDAIFENYDSDQRIIVLMNILGQQQKVVMQAEQLEKASE